MKLGLIQNERYVAYLSRSYINLHLTYGEDNIFYKMLQFIRFQDEETVVMLCSQVEYWRIVVLLKNIKKV
jgi:hypothetical protein